MERATPSARLTGREPVAEAMGLIPLQPLFPPTSVSNGITTLFLPPIIFHPSNLKAGSRPMRSEQGQRSFPPPLLPRHLITPLIFTVHGCPSLKFLTRDLILLELFLYRYFPLVVYLFDSRFGLCHNRMNALAHLV